jgi:DNA polymerase-3 subunit gamma/tau
MYKALYRKWRPKTFDDVISQSHVTNTLKNQLLNGKTAHAYLFTGSRGTGKTTCARIFAKALCCLNSTDGNPCLECEVCRDVENSQVSDIVEIDAASNNSVEDVRDLREGTVYLPERCRYKVYIIDEVHMLSSSAFNALLKTMEEPPEFVKFILATTEVHKVPATILSRCQRYDFKRILPEDIAARLAYIAEHEDFTLSEQAALLIAKLSDGGMRDAISMLDQASAFSNEVTEETVSSAMGLAGREYLFDALDYIGSRDVPKLFELIDSLYTQSKDLLVFCNDLISQVRNVMVLKVAPAQANAMACMPNELERLQRVAEATDLKTILYYMDSLEACHARLSKGADRRVELEVSLASLCSGEPSAPVDAPQRSDGLVTRLVERIDSLERRLDGVSSGANLQSSSRPQQAPQRKAEPEARFDPEFRRLKPSDFKPLEQWQSVLDALVSVSPGVRGALEGSRAFVHRDYVLIVASELFNSLFKEQYHANVLVSVVDKTLGGHYRLRVRSDKGSIGSSNSTQNPGFNSSFSDLIDRAKANDVSTTQVD